MFPEGKKQHLLYFTTYTIAALAFVGKCLFLNSTNLTNTSLVMQKKSDCLTSLSAEQLSEEHCVFKPIEIP